MFFLLAISTALWRIDPIGIDKLCWLIADAVVVVLLWPLRNQFLRLLQQNKIIVSWPILACVSALWSLAPFASVYQGLQLFMTVMIALLLCIYADLEHCARLVLYSLLATAFVTIVLVVLDPSKAAGDWSGGFPHKNNLGEAMALMIVTALCLLMQGWRPRICLVSIVLGLVLLFLTRSGTSWVAVPVSLVPVVFVALAMLTVAVTMMAVFGAGLDPADFVLSSIGKDSSLTGRTVLWEVGLDAFWSRPILGFGYKGYWADPSGTGRQLVFLVTDQGLWFFHNSFLELAVAFGFIGPILLALTLVIGMGGAFGRFLATREAIGLWPILLTLQLTLYCFSENPLFQNHSYTQVLFVAAIAARLKSGAAVARHSRLGRAQPVMPRPILGQA